MPRRWRSRSPRASPRPCATPSPRAITGGRRPSVFCHTYQLLAEHALKFLFDFFPVILFFVAFKVADIYWATAVAIAATIVQIGYVLARGRKVTGMQWRSEERRVGKECSSRRANDDGKKNERNNAET